jgi:hypothetical protein
MQIERNQGKGKLGPVGSLSKDAGLIEVKFIATYQHELMQHSSGFPATPRTKCLGLSIVASDERVIASGEYYLHAGYDGLNETMRVSNQTGEWRRLSLCAV